MLRFLPFVTVVAVASCHSGSKESFNWLGFLADAGLTTAKLSAAGIPILAPLALDAKGAIAGAGLNAYTAQWESARPNLDLPKIEPRSEVSA